MAHSIRKPGDGTHLSMLCHKWLMPSPSTQNLHFYIPTFPIQSVKVSLDPKLGKQIWALSSISFVSQTSKAFLFSKYHRQALCASSSKPILPSNIYFSVTEYLGLGNLSRNVYLAHTSAGWKSKSRQQQLAGGSCCVQTRAKSGG